jgi:hypothetical protein
MASHVSLSSISFVHTVSPKPKRLDETDAARLPLRGLSRDTLVRLRDGPKILDRDVPGLSELFLAETASFVSFVDQLRSSTSKIRGLLMTMRGFEDMSYVKLLDHLEFRLRVCDRLNKSSRTWKGFRHTIRIAGRELEKREEKLVTAMFFSSFVRLESVETDRRRAVAFVRVLRKAVSELLGEPAEFDDPFGVSILRREEDGLVIYWSAGENGLDSGGAENRDIVWAMKK